MILALHLIDINGHPYSVHAVGADGDDVVCQIGPALVRPQDWKVPEGSMPRSHRECVKWGLPLRELLAAVLRMAECADTFVAHGMEATDFRLRGWSSTDKALAQRMDGWNREGVTRACTEALVGIPAPSNAMDVLRAYQASTQVGAAA